MKLLAVDTSTEACSAALLCGGEVISRYELAPRRHNALILNMAESLLDEAGMTLKQLDGLAFAHGPGSFTGVRVSAGVIQGLALGLDLPVVPVSTLATMAHRAFREHGAKSVGVAIDARMQEVYWGEFFVQKIGQVDSCGEARVCSPKAVAYAAKDSAHNDWAAVGTGWGRYADELTAALQRQPAMLIADFFPHSHDIALMGKTMFEYNKAVSAEHAMPVYLRDNVAIKSKDRA